MKWILLLLLTPVLLATIALFSNRPPIWDTPGPLVRLKLYLTTNLAETRVDHALHELRPLQLELPEAEARSAILQAMERLGWREIRADTEVIRGVVVTPLLSFKDDVEVRLRPINGSVLVQVRSKSRVGRGDFAANTRHIIDLLSLLSE